MIEVGWAFRSTLLLEVAARHCAFAALRIFVIGLLVCCSVFTLSARAIECLDTPNKSESGWWSWRQIDGRKCWYKKVGAVPPKSEFVWPDQAKETSLAGEPVPQESLSTQAPKAMTATSPQIEVARAKPIDPTSPKLRFQISDGVVDLMKGSSLLSYEGLGGAWQIPPYSVASDDTFDERYGRW